MARHRVGLKSATHVVRRLGALSKLNIVTEYIGSTLRSTFINSGATASPIYSCLRDKDDVMVSSRAGVDSGNGHYYADLPLPTSACWMVNEWGAVISANTYRRFQLIEVAKPEVD
jgi:hypothetical protein